MRDLRSLALALLLPLAGCGPTAVKPAAVPGTAAPTITVVKPQRKSITRVVEQPGAVEPYEEATLYAKLPGFVAAIAADPARKADPPGNRRLDIGSRVAAGQLLAEVAIPELVEEAKQKEALVNQTAAEVELAVKSLAASDSGVAAAEAYVIEVKAGLRRAQALFDRWQSEATRTAGLVQSGVIDAQSRDETQNQFRAAQASREEAAAKVGTAEAAVRKAAADRGKAAAEVAAAEARREVARAEVRRVAALVGYMKITAPFEGIVTRRTVSVGDFLPANAKQGVFTVARFDPVRVVVRVPEADAGLVKEGLPATLAVQSLSGTDLTGTIARTSWSLEPGSRTLRTEIDVPNPDGRVRPGTYAYARISAVMPEGWVVPAAAVGKAGDDAIVYFAEGGKAVRTPVRLGRGDGQVTTVREYKRPGAAEWTAFTGSEAVATPAAALTDGQSVPSS